MAAPNIVNVLTIYGRTAVQAVNTVTTTIVSNSAASGKVLKINSLTIANVDGANSADISVDLFRTATSTSTRFAYLVTVPAKSTLTLVDITNKIYLEEGDSLRCAASNVSRLEAICSYEDIS